ncbi:amidohydrolase family protein [Niabella aurantiaca]|uniref:amidohydrolase family protein n=1 Tax=Niabella aurantiaca TaxID=379900 RepID=UPI000476F52D|nr:amidohydrolase family protein [Niabella aurantiaca]
MLIDINAYTGHWPFMQLQYGTCATLLARMNKFGVHLSVISNLNGIFYKNTQSANRELYDELRSLGQHSSRFLPFAVINPTYAGWQHDLEECVKKFGMKGVRVYPKYHDYEINDPSLVELVKKARDMDLPVAFNYKMVDSRQRSWMDIDYVAYTPKPEWSLKNIFPIIKAVPDAKYMILNVTNSMQLEEADAALFRKANVLMDTSGRTINDLGNLLKTQGTGRFAFGTHAPILDYLTGMLRIEALRESEASTVTKELLRSGNAKKFLGL